MLTWVSRNYFANTRNKLKYLFCYFFHFKKGNCLPFSCSSLLQILIQDLLFQKSCDRKLSISKQNSKDLLMFLDSNCSAKVQISPHTTMVLAWEPRVVKVSPTIYPRIVVNYDLSIFPEKFDPLILESQTQLRTFPCSYRVPL